MSALLELAERCEKATGPDRILDYEIRSAIGLGVSLSGKITKVTREGWETVHYEGGGISQGAEPRRYTASLDAAMTLVPEGCLFTVRTLWDGPIAWGYAYVMIYEDSGESSDGKRYVDEKRGLAQHPALALGAAALRARAAMEAQS